MITTVTRGLTSTLHHSLPQVHHSLPQVHQHCMKLTTIMRSISILRWRMWNLLRVQMLNLVCDIQLLLSWYSPCLLKHTSPKSGSHQSMCSLPMSLVSKMSTAVVFMSSSVPCFNIKESMVVTCIGSWILEMPGWPVGCSDTQNSAGVMRLSMLPTEPKILLLHVLFLLTLAWKETAASQLPLSASESHRSPIHIISSHTPK